MRHRSRRRRSIAAPACRPRRPPPRRGAARASGSAPRAPEPLAVLGPAPVDGLLHDARLVPEALLAAVERLERGSSPRRAAGCPRLRGDHRPEHEEDEQRDREDVQTERARAHLSRPRRRSAVVGRTRAFCRGIVVGPALLARRGRRRRLRGGALVLDDRLGAGRTSPAAPLRAAGAAADVAGAAACGEGTGAKCGSLGSAGGRFARAACRASGSSGRASPAARRAPCADEVLAPAPSGRAAPS